MRATAYNARDYCALGTPLTERESQLADKVVEGKLNKVIAFELGLTEGTIKEYLHRMFRKTGATNRTELAVMMVRRRQKLDKINSRATGTSG
jgi:DNA-binding NarL/FixJ family response regulator